MKLQRLTLSLLTLFTLFLGMNQTWAQEGRNTSEYNLNAGVGLHGYDPVAIFPEGGGSALKGEQNLRLDYMGVAYFFAKKANLDLFVQDPEKYEPTYGGWCAYAMASGAVVDIQPKFFTIHGNRAHYFVSSRAKRAFDQDILGHEERADRNWKRISGEEARF